MPRTPAARWRPRIGATLSALCILMTGSVTVLAGRATALAALPCDPRGVRPIDGVVAGRVSPQLNGRMRGALSAYRVSCARVITETVRARGFPIRAAQIALTTVIVESTTDDLDGGHGRSVGLFQQTASREEDPDQGLSMISPGWRARLGTWLRFGGSSTGV